MSDQSLIAYMRTRLAQIATGDYKACGLTAEEVAADVLIALRDAFKGDASTRKDEGTVQDEVVSRPSSSDTLIREMRAKQFKIDDNLGYEHNRDEIAFNNGVEHAIMVVEKHSQCEISDKGFDAIDLYHIASKTFNSKAKHHSEEIQNPAQMQSAIEAIIMFLKPHLKPESWTCPDCCKNPCKCEIYPKREYVCQSLTKRGKPCKGQPHKGGLCFMHYWCNKSKDGGSK